MAPASAPPGSTNAQELPTSVIVARVDPAVVDVNVRLGYQHGFTAATGMILTSNGLVLTNNHVIDGATTIDAVSVANGRTYPATLAGVDTDGDVALIQLQGATGLPTISISDLSPVPGDPIVAIGNAGGVGGAPSVSTGTVIALGQAIIVSGPGVSEQLYGVIQTTAVLRPGDYGGPLVDGHGQIVGMDTASTEATNSSPSVSAAIPMDYAMAVAQQVQSGQAGGGVYLGLPAFLGINLSGAVPAGSEVTNVEAGSPAAEAGIVPGDSIVAIDGTTVDSNSPLSSVLRIYAPGEAVTVSWVDPQGRSHHASVVLGTGPAD